MERYYEICCNNNFRLHVKAKAKPSIKEVFKTFKKDLKKCGVSEIFGVYEVSRSEIREREDNIMKFGY